MSNKEFAQEIKEEGLKYSFNPNNNLKESLDQLTIAYLSIFLQTNALLEEYFYERKNSSITLPIDFKDLASYLGISVAYKELNYFSSCKDSSRLSLLENSGDPKYPEHIIINSKEPRLQQNYGLCYQIANHLYKQEDVTCRDSRLYQTIEENVIDTIASFLILPPMVTFYEMDDYMRSCSRHVDLNELFMHLSPKTQMPLYKVITSYEKLKVLGYYFYSSPKSKEELIDKYLNTEELAPLKEEAKKTLRYQREVHSSLYL